MRSGRLIRPSRASRSAARRRSGAICRRCISGRTARAALSTSVIIRRAAPADISQAVTFAAQNGGMADGLQAGVFEAARRAPPSAIVESLLRDSDGEAVTLGAQI